MGDSTLFIAICETSHNVASSSKSSKDQKMNYRRTSKRLPADSSLRDAIDLVHSVVVKDYPSTSLDTVSLIDCSYHPPRKVSLNEKNRGYSGPNSVTLQSMGWFPSGKILAIIGKNGVNPNEGEEDFFLSNLPHWEEEAEGQSPLNDGNKVLLKKEDGSYFKQTPTPSAVLGAVVSRSYNEPDNQSLPTQPPPERRSEVERCAKIDARIRDLDAKVKKKDKVSEKVRQMLIKSRAKGEKRLREEDRFYVEVVIIDDDDEILQNETKKSSSSYHFFSRMASVGKVATSVSKSSAKKNVELLVKFHPKSNGENSDDWLYCRLPNTMPLYEAQKKGYLQHFDRIVIRIFSEDGKASRSISELES